jgi:predicted phage terminase large subunit-like protein
MRDIEAAYYESSLYEFLKAGWRYIDPNPYVDSWHLGAIAEHLEAVRNGQITRLIINQPPRTSKSSMLVAFDPWVWAQAEKTDTSGPGVQFLHASYAQNLSIRDSVKTRRLIESPWYQKYWGNRVSITTDQNTKTRFDNNQGGYRLATSVGGALTGEGGNCFVAGTMVSTPTGTMPIDQILAGQKVMAFDHSRGRVVVSRVLATQTREATELYEIHTSRGHSFVCTGNHPIFIPLAGYIPACELGVGDRVLCEKRASGDVQPVVRQLRNGDAQALVRIAQGVAAGIAGRILFQEMLFGASLRKKHSILRKLLATCQASQVALLFGRMYGNLQGSEAFQKGLQGVQKAISWGRGMLLPRVCWQDTFPAHAGFAELQVCEAGQVFKPVQGNGGDCAGAGRASLRRLRYGGSPDQSTARTHALSPAYTSYQREHAGQQAREPDYLVQFMPQDAPSWDADVITSIAVHRGEPQPVYDIQVEGQSNFYANGVLAHNCIIIDDPHNAMETESELIRTNTLEWFDNSLSTRLNNPRTGAIILVMQRLHEGDLTGHILSSDAGQDWVHLMLPMRYEPDRAAVLYPNAIGWEDPREEEGELLTPERYDETSVARLERQLGPFQAAGQLQQRPEPKGGGILKRDWWRDWDRENYPEVSYVLASIDTAYTAKEENDYSAMTVWGIFEDDNEVPRVMLMNAWRAKLEFHELVEKIAATARKFKVDNMLVENKATGISVAQEIRRVYGYEDWGLQLMDPKGQDKVARAYSVQHLFADDLVYAPLNFSWADMVVTECASFPKAKNDDLVDTVTQALRFLRATGMLTRGSERTAQLSDSLAFNGNSGDTPLYPV